MWLSFAGQTGAAFQSRSDAAAVGLSSDELYLDPIIFCARIAAQQLREVVDCVHHNVDVAVVIEVPKSTPARGRGCGDARTSLQRNVLETPVAQIAIEQFALRISRLRLQLLDFGINVAIAKQNVGPTIVIHVEKSAAPAQVLRVGAKTRRKRGILKISASEIV